MTPLLRDYVHVRVNQWPVGSPCLPHGQFVKNQTVSVLFSYVALCTLLYSAEESTTENDENRALVADIDPLW